MIWIWEVFGVLINFKNDFLCIDCHHTEKHQIAGRAFSVSTENTNKISCTDCHRQPPHQDERLNTQLARVACTTCHIPSFARNVPTKMEWDWSKAGDSTRLDDPQRYQKSRGEWRSGPNLPYRLMSRK